MMLLMFGILHHVLLELKISTVIPITTDQHFQPCIDVQCQLLFLLLLLPDHHDEAE